jgi:FMN phosphatase YigB (HAD superfamily)
VDKARVLMIGDSLSADIMGGIRFGIDTCWVNLKGEAGHDAIRPTHEVHDLYALKQIIL